VRGCLEEHPSTLTSMANLAFTFKFQGRNDEAVSTNGNMLPAAETGLGPQHPYATSSLNALDEWQLEDIEIRL
jgi:hypothetical protein